MSIASNIPQSLKSRLLTVALSASVGAGAGYNASHQSNNAVSISTEVLLAMELGDHYEGLRLTPYRDSAGVWTVCRGITHGLVINKTYTESECKQLELSHYQQLEREARGLYHRWDEYNIWVRASMLDMLFNLGVPQVRQSTHIRLANAGNLTGACEQMTRWVWARDGANGAKVQLAGLVDRRGTTAELCTQWGQTGHLIAEVVTL